jgi:UDP-N-acetylglucosamine diphosphorylase/glucosamine-1-phosphate N-acetyltransferase
MKKQIILFDDARREQLLPLTYTRPVAMIRIGILTIAEKWGKMFNKECNQFYTESFLRRKFPLRTEKNECLMINGGVLPNKFLVEEIKALNLGEALFAGTTLIATLLPEAPESRLTFDQKEYASIKIFNLEFDQIIHPWDIFVLNGKAIKSDFDLITKDRKSEPISSSNQTINLKNIFIEEGAVVECSVLNATDGPIYIGKNSEVMEGSLVRGPFALCEHSALKLGAKIYGSTTIGPHCKVGGEVNNSVIFGYSSKAHDGFLGNSVIGEWCNLGADTNTSNLKNNYANVKLWNYVSKGFVDTGLQFCGLIMGDHSKCGINTMFNTGTLVGVSANIYGDGFPRNFIPSFSWGGAQGFTTYKTNKAFETAEKVMQRRGLELTEVDKEILTHIFEITSTYRH